MRMTYRVIAYLIVAGVAVQAASLALATFGVIHDSEAGQVIDQNYVPNVGATIHGLDGMYVIPALAIALLIVSFFAKVSRGTMWALLVILAVAVQIFLAFMAFAVEAVGALHGLNAIIVLGLAAIAATRPKRRVAMPQETVQVTTTAA